jgi:hypothetical protein
MRVDIHGRILTRKTEERAENPAPVPISPPQMPHDNIKLNIKLIGC